MTIPSTVPDTSSRRSVPFLRTFTPSKFGVTALGLIVTSSTVKLRARDELMSIRPRLRRGLPAPRITERRIVTCGAAITICPRTSTPSMTAPGLRTVRSPRWIRSAVPAETPALRANGEAPRVTDAWEEASCGDALVEDAGIINPATATLSPAQHAASSRLFCPTRNLARSRAPLLVLNSKSDRRISLLFACPYLPRLGVTGWPLSSQTLPVGTRSDFVEL